jgi:hypothetical protein
MANLGMNFNPSEHESVDLSAMPDGEYQAMIVDSEIKATRDNSNQYLALTFQITEGPFEGRFVWHNLNLWSHNDTAKRISQGQLTAICEAIGYNGIVNDSEVLHNRIMAIKVKYVPPKGDFKEKNEIKSFKALAGGQAAQPAPQQQQQPLAQQAAQHQPQQASQPTQQPAQNAAPAQAGAPVWAQQ